MAIVLIFLALALLASSCCRTSNPPKVKNRKMTLKEVEEALAEVEREISELEKARPMHTFILVSGTFSLLALLALVSIHRY